MVQTSYRKRGAEGPPGIPSFRVPSRSPRGSQPHTRQEGGALGSLGVPSLRGPILVAAGGWPFTGSDPLRPCAGGQARPLHLRGTVGDLLLTSKGSEYLIVCSRDYL